MIVPLPHARRQSRGTVHVTGDRIDGFEVTHESASGNSWGGIDRFASGQDAITAAYALNRDTYDSLCDVFVCDAATEDGCPDVGLVSLPGDF